MRKARRLVISNEAQADGTCIRQNPDHAQIDLTGVANASARFPVYAVIQEQCNLGCWHNRTQVELPCWGDD